MTEEGKTDRFKEASKVTIIGSVANFFLAFLKIFLGIIGTSSAMIADGIHSFSDLATDIAVLFGVKASSKPSDEGHRYGHGKIETMITMVIGLVLVGAGAVILFRSSLLIQDAINGKPLTLPKPVALLGAVVSILVKEALYWYTKRTGERIGSKVLIANAWHHRTDSLSSAATLVGIGGALLLGGTWAVLDPIAAVLVTILIFWVAFKIMRDCIRELVETSLDKRTEKEIMDLISGVDGVKEPHNLKTRSVGGRAVIDIHIKVEAPMDVRSAHSIVEVVEDKVKERFGSGTIINVHMDPDDQ
ncbi:MAG: cation diffusion facilitator family transporter [Thermoplasmatota archaeon]